MRKEFDAFRDSTKRSFSDVRHDMNRIVRDLAQDTPLHSGRSSLGISSSICETSDWTERGVCTAPLLLPEFPRSPVRSHPNTPEASTCNLGTGSVHRTRSSTSKCTTPLSASSSQPQLVVGSVRQHEHMSLGHVSSPHCGPNIRPELVPGMVISTEMPTIHVNDTPNGNLDESSANSTLQTARSSANLTTRRVGSPLMHSSRMSSPTARLSSPATFRTSRGTFPREVTRRNYGDE